MYLYFGLAVSNIKMFPHKARLFEASRRFANFKGLTFQSYVDQLLYFTQFVASLGSNDFN